MPENFYGEITAGKEPYFIADIGANHNGDIELAKRMIDELAKIGCHAAKFQSWSKQSLFIKEFYEEQSQFVDEKFGTLEEMVEKFSLSKDDHLILKEHCERKKIAFCSTPFSPEEVDLLEELNVPFFKVASMDLNNPTLLRYIARKGKPVILSTGMGSMEEIERALEVIDKAGNQEVVLLHCVSLYPPDDETVNLNNIVTLREKFELPVGFSDHTIGTSIPLAAVALGAKVIEKHFTLDKAMDGWDHAVSADPGEMKTIVKEGKRITKALGKRERVLSEKEIDQRKAFRRSIVAGRDLKKGEVISEKDLDFKRPGTGIGPDEAKKVVGRKINRDIGEDQIIRWEDLD